MTTQVFDKIANLTQASQQAEIQLHKTKASVMDPGNGRVLHVPGQPPMQMTGPSQALINALLLNGLALALQNTRFALIALNELAAALSQPAGPVSPDAKETPPCAT